MPPSGDSVIREAEPLSAGPNFQVVPASPSVVRDVPDVWKDAWDWNGTGSGTGSGWGKACGAAWAPLPSTMRRLPTGTVPYWLEKVSVQPLPCCWDTPEIWEIC